MIFGKAWPCLAILDLVFLPQSVRPDFVSTFCPDPFYAPLLSENCFQRKCLLFSEEIFVVFRRNIVPHSSTFAKYLLSHPKVEEKLKTLKNPVKIAILDCEQCEQL